MSRSIDPSPEQFAEAAAWVARMHGPNHTIEVDRAFERWLSVRPEHGVAFESMTDGWEATGLLEKEPLPKVGYWERVGYRHGFLRSVVAVAAISMLALGTFFYLQSTAGVTTNVGEQRLLTLDDGSRVYLNTDTRIRVRYDDALRRVQMESGEALFEVARRADRPFIVEVNGRRVRALGTSFVVREDSRGLAVTLIEGKVAVTSIGPESVQERPNALFPGQRLTFVADRPPTLDQPVIEKVTAWRRGLVDFLDTPLAEAVQEMNRYSGRKVAIANAADGAFLVTGVFRAGDTDSFAEAVEQVHGVRLQHPN